jgi:thymidylate kinase
MKLLIIEGMDRCGKDTIIGSLLKDYPHFVCSHFGYPVGETNEEKRKYQVLTFWKEFSLQQAFRKSNGLFSDGLYVWNRSHIGECVYGPMYRESDPNWIFELEENFFDNSDDVYLLYLYADVEFLLKNDDGNSFTTGIEKKRNEAALFEKAVDQSIIKNKLKLKVNHGDSYIDQTEIYNIVKEFLSV